MLGSSLLNIIILAIALLNAWSGGVKVDDVVDFRCLAMASYDVSTHHFHTLLQQACTSGNRYLRTSQKHEGFLPKTKNRFQPLRPLGDKMDG